LKFDITDADSTDMKSARLLKLQTSPKTFTEEINGVRCNINLNRISFTQEKWDQFIESFNIDSRTQEISSLLKNNEAFSLLHTQLGISIASIM
jgi:hypothetical protein